MKRHSAICNTAGFCKATLAAVLILLLQGCVSDSPDLTPAGTKVVLNLSVMTSTSDTRAGHADDMEEDGTDAENYIDIDNQDLRVFLLTKRGEILQEVPNIPWTKSETPGSSIYSVVNKEIFFNDETDADKALIESVKNDGVNVLVLANTRNARWEGGAGSFPTTLDALWSDGTGFNFNYVRGADNTSWAHTHEGSRKLIQMFGINRAELTSNAGVYRARSVIKMQRAMAKVEVIDNIPIDGVSLSNVAISDYNQVGRLIPDLKANPDWDKLGEQVGVSSLPANPEHFNGLPLNFIHIRGRNNEKDKWIAYIPEMKLEKPDADGNLSADRTHLNLKIAATGEFSMFDGAEYPLHFARYVNNTQPTVPDESWNHILRNHIYRFYVNNVGVDTQIELHVVPWQLDDDEEWDFTDNVTVAQMLEWKANAEGVMTYEDLDKSNGRVLLWIDEDLDKILTGTFRIKTPINGKWVARLTPLDDALPNAMSFVDAKGIPLTPHHGDPPVCLETSGIIERESPAYIRIRATNFGVDIMSAYKLEFFVQNVNFWTRVPLVNEQDKAPGALYECYTIVRKSNKLQ